ncbi:hypothetical protein BGZ65_006912 [Modicella reniformis]|uniref:Uncharacterized protein n=1 Tax=Modicella reniformis TaxID=1440133 RepID=A0A9P6IJL5_9FUNG|nr:hypothetical protein BGZ65_006912 [Modicella reniformis]
MALALRHWHMFKAATDDLPRYNNGRIQTTQRGQAPTTVSLRLKGGDHSGNTSQAIHINNPSHSHHPTKPITNAITIPGTTTTALEQVKLNRITRLLQLLIACTSVQARLPALRYPGYGQQWIRAPCRVDYLQHYIDQQQGGEIMIQCFHLLFADLIQCRSDDETQGLGSGIIPIAPPDKEAYRVLYQIQREFMTHCALRIRTLSFSVAQTVEHAISLVPQLVAVTRLELTDLEAIAESRSTTDAVEKVLDFVKSHRMLFGPILKDLSLAGQPTGNYKLLTVPNSPMSPTMTGLTTPPTSVPSSPTTPFGPWSSSPFADSYTTRVPSITNKNHQNNILAIIEAIKDPERIDALGWTSAILYLDRIPPTELKSLWLSFAFPPSESVDSKAARLSEYLDRCRKLEELRAPIRRPDVFGWAAHEKKSSLICAPILAGSKTKRLPNLRRIHLQGPSHELMDCLLDAAFAFQDTLQDLEACSRLPVWQPTILDWEWYMPQLTRLRLEGQISMHFSLDALQRCPVLEELSLSTFATEDSNDQRPEHLIQNPHQHHYNHLPHQYQHHQPQYHYHQIPDPAAGLLMYIRSQEMHRIGSCTRLKTLRLAGPWPIPDIALRRVADRCKRLRELALDRTLRTTTGGVLLAVENMHKLERLDLRMDVEDLHLVRVVARKLPSLSHVRVTSLRRE